MWLLRTVRSQIKYKIILPYLLLMILVTLAGSGIALILVANSWQERFDDQLGQTARNFTGAFAQHEINNLDFLARVSFTEANPATGAPSVREALAQRDPEGLERALDPLYRSGVLLENLLLDRLIAFDTEGNALTDWERSPLNPNIPRKYIGTSLSGIEQVRRVVHGEIDQVNGQTLDKFSALIKFRSDENEDRLYFFTVAPVRSGNQIVGGLLIAARLDNLLQTLQTQSQSGISSIYDISGMTLGTTAAGIDLRTLDMSQELLLEVTRVNEEVRNKILAITPDAAVTVPASVTPANGTAIDPCLDIGNQQGGLVNPLQQSRLPSCSVKTRHIVADREYEFVHAPLLIRGAHTGYFSVSLSRDFIVSAWSSSRWLVMVITAILAVGAVLVGYRVARQITLPLSSLVNMAEAVTQGNLAARSDVKGENELSRLSDAFNQMTEHLLQLYTVSRDLNQAIEVRRVLEITASAAASFVPRSEALALLDEPGGWRYHVRASAPVALHYLAEKLLTPDELLIRSMDLQRGVRLWHADDDPALHSCGLTTIGGLQTALITPVLEEERLAGLLILGHPEAHAFGEAEAQVLTAIASMGGNVLRNAILYGRVQKDAKERQAILASIGDGVIVCDSQGRIMLLNHAAEQMLGLHDWRENAYTFDELALAPISSSEVFTQGAGEVRYQIGMLTVSRNDAPVIAEDGQSIGTVIVLHDITAAVAVDQAKTQFIATISHEFRTPLQIIRGYVDLVLRGVGGPLTSDQIDFLEQVRKQEAVLTNMANNAITFANLAVGKMSTELQALDVWMMVELALSPLRPAFNNKGIAINLIDVDADLPPVLADREQLKIVLGQLFDNAHRYTDSGSVTVRAQVEGQSIHIEIEDTGKGIEPRILSRLFTPFQRIGGNESSERGGGLGLAIARQLLERQGGKIRAQSTPGQGSVFSVLLPQANEHSLAVAQPDESAAASP